MGKVLSSTQIEQFRDEGWAGPIKVYSEDSASQHEELALAGPALFANWHSAAAVWPVRHPFRPSIPAA